MEHIDNAIFSLENITEKRKSIIAPIIAIIIGSAMVWKSEELDIMVPSVKIGGALTVIGAFIALYGLIAIFVTHSGKKRIPCLNGKALVRTEKYFEANKLTLICNAVNSRDLSKIQDIKENCASSVILVTYTDGNGFTAAQVLEYVPHQHIPATDVVVM